MTSATDNSQDIIDIRDIIERFEELEGKRNSFVIGSPEGEEAPAPEQWTQENPEDSAELTTLEALLNALRGNGGDEQWRGDWYPHTLLRDDHFESAMDEVVEDCYELPKDLPSFMIITLDYKALQMDYTSVDYDGVTYWYR